MNRPQKRDHDICGPFSAIEQVGDLCRKPQTHALSNFETSRDACIDGYGPSSVGFVKKQ